MPQLVPTQQAVYTALPGGGPQPVQQPKQQAPEQPQQPPDPFKVRPGPPLLLLPHDSHQPAAVQQRRGVPTRMGREHIPQLFENVKADPHNDEHWHALADALDEAGKPHTAAGFRLIAKGTNGGHRGFYYKMHHPARGTRINCEELAYGSVAGIPVYIGHEGWFWVGNITDKSGSSTTEVSPEMTRGLVGEIDEPRKFSRGTPVRLGREHIPQLFENVKADPHNDEHWHALADALDEAGKPHTAAGIRDLITNGDKAAFSKHVLYFHQDYMHPTDDPWNGFKKHGHCLHGTIAGIPAHMESGFVNFGDNPDIMTTGCYWLPKHIADAIASEFDQPPPERSSKGTPVRLGSHSAYEHADVQQRIADDMSNPEHKMLYADMLDNDGHPEFAEAFRRAAEPKERRRPSFYDSSSGGWSAGYETASGAFAHNHVPGLGVMVHLREFQGKKTALVQPIVGMRGVESHQPKEGKSLLGFETGDMDFVNRLLDNVHESHVGFGHIGHVRYAANRNIPMASATEDRFGNWTVTHNDGREHYIQSDWEIPSLASHLGWQACPCGQSDGTVECPQCHLTAGEMIQSATEFLREHEGERFEDPGYFQEPTRPEHFAASRAPAGGFIVRGIQSKGGEFLPEEATVANPAPRKPVNSKRRTGMQGVQSSGMRERLRGRLRRKRDVQA